MFAVCASDHWSRCNLAQHEKGQLRSLALDALEADLNTSVSFPFATPTWSEEQNGSRQDRTSWDGCWTNYLEKNTKPFEQVSQVGTAWNWKIRCPDATPKMDKQLGLWAAMPSRRWIWGVDGWVNHAFRMRQSVFIWQVMRPLYPGAVDNISRWNVIKLKDMGFSRTRLKLRLIEQKSCALPWRKSPVPRIKHKRCLQFSFWWSLLFFFGLLGQPRRLLALFNFHR